MKRRKIWVIYLLCGLPGSGGSIIMGLVLLDILVPRSTRPHSSLAHAGRAAHTQNFSPISAATYLAQAAQVSVPDSGLDFRVYYTPPAATGPEGESVLLFV